jgi:hypothetical protein
MVTLPLESEQIIFKASQNHRLLSDTGLYDYKTQTEIFYNRDEQDTPELVTLRIKVTHKVTNSQIETQFLYSINLSDNLQKNIAYDLHEELSDLIQKTIPGTYEDVSLKQLDTKEYQGAISLESEKTPINLL